MIAPAMILLLLLCSNGNHDVEFGRNVSLPALEDSVADMHKQRLAQQQQHSMWSTSIIQHA